MTEELLFHLMTEAQLREWVEANPGRVTQRCRGASPLEIAAGKNWLSLVQWLLDITGADVNTLSSFGNTPLQYASSVDILTALMDRGADPTLPNEDGGTPLITHALRGRVDLVARLLQDQRVRATINVQESHGYTALHWTSLNCWPKTTIPIFHLLLQAGVNLMITSTQEDTALDLLREFDPTQNDAIALLEEYPSAKKDADKASLLVEGRRLVTISRNAVAPSYLQSRVLHDVPLPRVSLSPAGSDGIEEKDRSMLA